MEFSISHRNNVKRRYSCTASVYTTTDAYLGANLEGVDGDVDDETGYSINAGLHAMVTEQMELIGASYKLIDELDIMQVTARYSF